MVPVLPSHLIATPLMMVPRYRRRLWMHRISLRYIKLPLRHY
jgi:hypothetical protein